MPLRTMFICQIYQTCPIYSFQRVLYIFHRYTKIIIFFQFILSTNHCTYIMMLRKCIVIINITCHRIEVCTWTCFLVRRLFLFVTVGLGVYLGSRIIIRSNSHLLYITWSYSGVITEICYYIQMFINIVSEFLTDINFRYFQFIISTQFGKPNRWQPSSPRIRFSINRRSRKSRLRITGSQCSIQLWRSHLILAVIGYHRFNRKVIKDFQFISQTKIETLIVIISPLQVTVIIHIPYGQAI